VRSANGAARRLLDLPDGDLGSVDLLAHLRERFTASVPPAQLRADGERHRRFELVRAISGAPRLDLSAALTRVDVPGEDGCDLVLCVRDVTAERQESRVKDRFLSLMSHKVLTPLTILLGHVDLLATEEPDNLRADQSESLRAVETSAHDLRALFDRLLGFADLSVNESKIHPRPESLSRIAGRVKSIADRWRGRKDVRVDVLLPPTDALVVVDPHYMDCVLDNLVENAVKFAEKDRIALRVEVVPASSPHRVALAITDDGPGVPPEMCERVFDRFDQVEADFTGNVDGLGLGLPLVRRIVERQGGAVRLRSSLRRGTTVILEMALAPPGADATCPVA
jgi:two-component system, OmpR family, phosphate regulon sensor histidine kinase PhoR